MRKTLFLTMIFGLSAVNMVKAEEETGTTSFTPPSIEYTGSAAITTTDLSLTLEKNTAVTVAEGVSESNDNITIDATGYDVKLTAGESQKLDLGQVTANSVWFTSGRYRINDALSDTFTGLSGIGTIYAGGAQLWFTGSANYTGDNALTTNFVLSTSTFEETGDYYIGSLNNSALRIGADTAISGDVTIDDVGAKIGFQTSKNLTLSGALKGAGALTLDGYWGSVSRLDVLGDTSGFTGDITIEGTGVTLNFGGGTSDTVKSHTITGDITAKGKVTVADYTNLTLSGSFTLSGDSAALQLNGANSTLTLNNADTAATLLAKVKGDAGTIKLADTLTVTVAGTSGLTSAFKGRLDVGAATLNLGAAVGGDAGNEPRFNSFSDIRLAGGTLHITGWGCESTQSKLLVENTASTLKATRHDNSTGAYYITEAALNAALNVYASGSHAKLVFNALSGSSALNVLGSDSDTTSYALQVDVASMNAFTGNIVVTPAQTGQATTVNLKTGAGNVSMGNITLSGANTTVNLAATDDTENTYTVGAINVSGGATLNAADVTTATSLKVSGAATQATFADCVTISGSSRIDIGYDTAGTQVAVTFSDGLNYTGSNNYAIVIGGSAASDSVAQGNTLNLGGTSDLGGKQIGINQYGKLVLLEGATLSNVGDFYNSANNNGTVELQKNSSLTFGSSFDAWNGSLVLQQGSSMSMSTSAALNVTLNGLTNNGLIKVSGTADAQSVLTFNASYSNQSDATDSTHTTNLGAVYLDNAQFKNNSACETAVRNITTLTVDGTSSLKQNSWNTFWNIANLNKGSAEGTRILTWDVTTNHWTDSVLSLTDAGTFDGTFVANRSSIDATDNGAYQACLEIAHANALQNAVLNITGNGDDYMTVAMNAATVNLAGLQGNALGIIIAGAADKTIGSSSSRQGKTAPTSATGATSTLVITNKDGAEDSFSGKLGAGISISKQGAGKQSFSGDMSSFNGSLSVSAGELNFAADITMSADKAVTMSGGTLTINNHNGKLTTTTLNVTGDSTMNADLAAGTITFGVVGSGTTAHAAKLTMGCDVVINTDTVIKLDDTLVTLIGSYSTPMTFDLIDGTVTDGTSSLTISGTAATYLTGGGLMTVYDTNNKALSGIQLGYNTTDKKLYLTPEPATATLSLLALAGLCARRRRH